MVMEYVPIFLNVSSDISWENGENNKTFYGIIFLPGKFLSKANLIKNRKSTHKAKTFFLHK